MSAERLKAAMTVSKALSLITNKYSVSVVDLKVACSASHRPCASSLEALAQPLPSLSSILYPVLPILQCEMVERHVRALNRISNNLKSGVVSSLTLCSIYTCWRDEEGRKKEASKVKQTTRQKQHSTPKAVAFPTKNELSRVHVNVHVYTSNCPSGIGTLP